MKTAVTILALDAPETPGAAPEHAALKSTGIDYDWREAEGLSAAELEAALGACDVLLTWRRPVDAATIARMQRCLMILQYGAGGPGSAAVDLEAARRAGIYVGSTPDDASDLWAARTAALLGAARNAALERGAAPLPAKHLRLGLVGFGQVARRVARMARGSMRIYAYDPFVNVEHFENAGVEFVADLAQLIGVSQALSLHAPLGPGTRGMIDAARLALMARDSVLVVAASPGLLDAAALLKGLERGCPAAVAFDAPLPEDHILFHATGVVSGPASIGGSLEARIARRRAAAEVVAEVWRGRRPMHLRIDPPCPRHALALAGEAWD